MLDTLSSRLSRILKTMRGQARLTEENTRDMVREIRLALLEADVALPVVRDLIARIKAKAMGEEVIGNLNPGQALVGVVERELTSVIGGDLPPEERTIRLNVQPPAVILLAGLQGAGKTTTAGKLAKWLKETQNKKVLTFSADVYRPAAIDQLKTVTEQAGCDFFPSTPEQKPLDIARDAMDWARRHFYDVVIADTAGRLAIDEQMMQEVSDLSAYLKPAETLFVIDAMLGQDAVNTAKAFTGDDPFVVIYGDDVIWGEDPVCAQLIRAYEEFGRPVAGVSAVPWEDVSRYCSLKTTPIHDNYFFVDDMIEKPKKGQEFSNYSILGRVLLTPEIYDILAHTKPGAGGEIQLTDAMAEYARNHGGMTAVEFTGKHYDMGNKLKVVEAQVELALQHPEIGEAFRAYLKEFCKTL